jgi:hypothetical protein
MTNEELLEKMRGIVREEIQAETKPMNTRLTGLEQGQAQITTGVEALAAGHQDIMGQVKAMRSEMATKADMQDLDAKLVKRVNSHEKRIDDLEKEAGLPNPHKN